MKRSFRQFIEKLGWIASSKLSFPITEEKFLVQLSENLDPYRSQGPFEAFSSSRNDYFGKINGRRFLMRRRRRVFDWTMGSVLVEGEVIPRDDRVDITAEVKFSDWIPSSVISLFVLLYSLALVVVLILIIQDPEVQAWMLGLVFVHALFFGGLFYVLFRQAISAGKMHFENDLRAMIKK